jgi:ABC-type transport system involved in multi-copper enzyme maturation permease subunit
MNAAILIAGRELRDNTRLFVTAAALAVLPFLLSVLPFVREKGNPDLIALLGGMAAFSTALGCAAVFGATTIGRELSDNRLSFYFSRPIAPASIWIGKTAAALFTSLACFAIIAVPAMLYARSAWRSIWTFGTTSVVLATVAGAIVLFFVMHAASTMARSRSALIALDFAMVVVVTVAVTMIVRPLVWAEAKEMARGVQITLAIAGLLIFAIAPVRQLAIGRTDRRRSHAALSKTLWPSIGVVLVVAAIFVGWVVMASPDDLTGEISVAQSPATGWLVASGNPALRGDYHASFLVDPKSEFRRVPPVWWGADFSRDGKTLVSGHRIGQPRKREIELHTLDLTRSDAEPVSTGIVFTWGTFVLSDDGRRLALREGENLSIHDLKDRKLLFSGRVFSRGAIAQFWFATSDVVRAIHWPEDGPGPKQKVAAILSEIDVVAKTQTKTGQTEPLERPYVTASEDGSRLLSRSGGLLLDGRTGATLARYGTIGGGRILRDGTVAVVTPWNQGARVTLHRPGAAPIEVALPKMQIAQIRGEIAPGRLAVQGAEKWEAYHYAKLSHLYVIDVATGKIERVDRNTRGPLLAWNNSDPRPLALDTGRPLAAYDHDGKVVMWNPLTGEKKATKIGQ